MLDVVLGLSAALGFGGSAVFARAGLQHMRSTTGTLVSLVVGSVLITALAFILHTDEILSLSGIAFLWFLLSGLLNFPMGRLLNYTGVSLAGVSKATPLIGTAPLFATVLAITVGGESINLPILAGTLLIVGGGGLILSQR
jgi:drug/metabolite transporter (DMT)-like permease